MNKDIKIGLIGGVAGAITGIVASIISGYFLLTTEERKQDFEKGRISNERHYLERKEMRELLSEYRVSTDLLYSKLRSRDLQDTMHDLLTIKKEVAKIKMMG